MYILKVIREINNYFFLRKTVKGVITSKNWKELNLRFDWLTGKIYTVINLPKDFPSLPDITRKAYVLEDMKAINLYLTSLNLHEIIHVEQPQKLDNLNYLVVYAPLWNYFTSTWLFKWTFRIIISILIMFYTQYKFGLLETLWEGIKIGFNFLF